MLYNSTFFPLQGYPRGSKGLTCLTHLKGFFSACQLVEMNIARAVQKVQLTTLLICSFFPELSESTLFMVHHCRRQQLPLKIGAGLEYQLVDESTKGKPSAKLVQCNHLRTGH